MRRICVNLMLFFVAFICFSENIYSGNNSYKDLKPVNEAEKEKIINTISSVSSKINSISSDFKQIKVLSMLNDKFESKGRMYYSQPNLLRWEYNSPYSYIFILNSSKVYLKSETREDVIDVKSSRLFAEISKIMMNSITGKSLTDGDDFIVSFYSSNGLWVACLVPKKKEMKQIFNKVYLYFDSSNYVVTKVVMAEKTGDETIIELNNVKLNEKLDAKIFSL